MNESIGYLCLQVTREGQASYAHVHEIVKGLRQQGFRVRLYEPMHGRVLPETGVLRRCLEFGWIQLRMMMRLHRHDMIYVRGHGAAVLVAWYAKLLALPVVQEINGPYEDSLIAWPSMRRAARVYRWMMRRQMSWASAVVAVTDLLGEWCKSEARHDRVWVIANGANVDIFNPKARCTLELPSKYMIWFGALARWQGVEMLLEAAESIMWPEDVSLVVAGDGPMRTTVEAAAAGNPRVRYLGVVRQRELAGAVAGALGGLVCKSDVGNRCATGVSPVKLYETLAAGTPVVTTDVPGMAEFVRRHGCGIVVPLGAPECIAQAVRQLGGDTRRARAMGRRGRDVVCGGHSWEQRADATARVLRLVLEGSAGVGRAEHRVSTGAGRRGWGV